jgi:predicted phage-related endonuclease
MTSLDLKKIKVELLQVQAAKASLELRIEERLDEIQRIKETIAVSEAKEKELEEKIKNHK